MKKIFFLIALIASFNCTAQTTIDSTIKSSKPFYLYVGEVNGISAEEYRKKRLNYRSDSILHLKDLTQSIYPIEIRFYESTPLYVFLQSEYCTILYFDTAWHIKRKKYQYGIPPDNYPASLIEDHQIKDINPETAYKILIENGIFNMTSEACIKTQHKAMTEKGLISAEAFCACTDCPNYEIETKVDAVFNIVYLESNFNGSLHCFPDNNLLRREQSIVNTLGAKPRLPRSD